MRDEGEVLAVRNEVTQAKALLEDREAVLKKVVWRNEIRAEIDAYYSTYGEHPESKWRGTYGEVK